MSQDELKGDLSKLKVKLCESCENRCEFCCMHMVINGTTPKCFLELAINRLEWWY